MVSQSSAMGTQVVAAHIVKPGGKAEIELGLPGVARDGDDGLRGAKNSVGQRQ